MKTKGILAIFILGVLLVSGFACGGGEATPTPTPTATPIIQAVDVTVVPTESGRGYFMGFVQNTGTSPGKCKKVKVRVYDEAGTMLGQDDYSLFLYLRPGERFPFCTFPTSQPVTSWQRYEVTVDTTPWGWAPTYELHPEVQVESHQREGEDITGVLLNGGQESAEVIVRAVGYASDGDIIASDGVSLWDVPPDVPTFFSIHMWRGDVSKVVTYDLFIKSRFLD